MIVKNTLKKIGHSLGRFISLIAIILIGVGFYAGIRQSAPAIRDAQTRFVKDTNMMDFHVISTLGFTEKDAEVIKKLDGVENTSLGYSTYVYSDDEVIRVMSIDTNINVFSKYEGTYPTKPMECLADHNHYKVGDVIRVREPENSENDEESEGDKKDDNKSSDSDEDEDDNEDILTEHTFIVTGTIVSPIYMGSDLGTASIGNGELKSYILVRDDCFDMDAYTDMYVTMQKTESDVPYSDSYGEKQQKVKERLEIAKGRREKARVADLYSEAKNKANEEVEKRRGEIEAEVRAEIEEEVRAEIKKEQDEATAELKEKAGKFGMTFEKFVLTLNEKVQEAIKPVSDEKINELVDEQMDSAMRTAMEEARKEAEAKIEIPECKWYIQTRNDYVTSYKSLKDQYWIVETIADIIPLFFIVIVFLMTSNTMSRMIAEERSEMGTFTSLGFSNISIIGGYMIYVLTATVFGVVLGYFIGVLTLPGFVFACFPVSLPDISVEFNPKMFWGSAIVSFLVMTVVTIFSCMKELIHKPSYLLRPVPPKRGKTLLMERIEVLWNHMSFSWKTTVRNLARYQRRVIMTVIGVGGCTFLMWIGFALRDCISTIGDKQYTELHHYEVMAVLDENVKAFDKISLKADEIDRDELNKLLVNPLMLHMENVKVENSENYSVDASLIAVDENDTLFEKYFTLREADSRDIHTDNGDNDRFKMGDLLKLSENGVIVTPRVASIMNAGIGNELVFKDADGESYTVTVEGIAENYFNNYIYMSKPLYKRVFRKGLMYNTVVSEKGMDNTEVLAEKLYDIDSFVSVNTSDKILKRANETIKGLDSIVLMLVVISSMLAFTVLYNLTAISISERTREIATLKVLGFSAFETNDYIYRETIISSLVGIAAGLLVAPFLHEKVMDMLQMDNLVFTRDVKLFSYEITIALSFAFTLVMMVVTFIKLLRINMIESLKSVD